MLLRAIAIATAAHGAIGQKRKYTGENYVLHPIAVMNIIRTNVTNHTDDMLAAAVLHDVLEDTQVTANMIDLFVTRETIDFVIGLTDVSCPADGNRAARKEIDRQHLAEQCYEVQTIKCADIIHNSDSILQYDKGFAKVYIAEAIALVCSLTKADAGLREMAISQLQHYGAQTT